MKFSRFFFSSLAASMSPISAWLMGYNFDHRGDQAFFTFVIAVTFFFFTVGYPGKFPGEK